MAAAVPVHNRRRMVRQRKLDAGMAEALLEELARHPVFQLHGERVATLTLRNCAARHLPVDDEVVRWAARFHDIMVLRPSVTHPGPPPTSRSRRSCAAPG